MPDTSLLTVNEAAGRCGVHPRTVRNWIRSGHLRAERLGPRTIRIHPDALDQAGRPVLDSGSPVDDHVARLIAEAPPLTPEQRDRIASLLRQGGAR